MASYAQIASERVGAIRRLEEVIDDDAAEDVLQNIIAQAPWLVEATWAPITANQGLKLFVRRFEKYYHERTGQDVTLAITHQATRPDFTLVNMGRKLHIVEIKAVGHSFGNDDWDRLHNYLEALEAFFAENSSLLQEFPDGWVVDLVCDELSITNRDKRKAYELWKDREQRIERIAWNDFLARAIKANEEFLNAQDLVREEAARLTTGSADR